MPITTIRGAADDSDQDTDNEEEDVNDDSHASNEYNIAQGFREFQRESRQSLSSLPNHKL